MNKIRQFFMGIWLFICYGPCKVAEWRDQAIRDGLTGLYNKSFFLEAGRRELATVKRLAMKGIDYPVALIFLDVDKFKKINDAEGHKAGDEVLKSVADLLKEVFQRETDIICRLGGGADEFAILLPQTATSNARELAAKFSSKRLLSPGRMEITVSCGMAQYRNGTIEEFLATADLDLYKVKKKSGGN